MVGGGGGSGPEAWTLLNVGDRHREQTYTLKNWRFWYTGSRILLRKVEREIYSITKKKKPLGTNYVGPGEGSQKLSRLDRTPDSYT